MNPVYSVGQNQSIGTTKLGVLLIDSRAVLLDSLSQAISCISDVTLIEAIPSVGAKAATSSSENSLINVVLYSAGVESTESIKLDIAVLAEQCPEASIVLLLERPQASMMELFDSGGIAGIIPASYSTNQLVNCLRLINSGVVFLPAEYSSHEASAASETHKDQLSVALTKKLTPRQREVLRYVSLGKSNKYIAAELSLCESTVKVHVHEVMKRLGATSRTHASYIANSVQRTEEANESEVVSV